MKFLNRGKDEEIEFSYSDAYGYSISLSNYAGDSCHVSRLTIEDMKNIKDALEETISRESL